MNKPALFAPGAPHIDVCIAQAFDPDIAGRFAGRLALELARQSATSKLTTSVTPPAATGGKFEVRLRVPSGGPHLLAALERAETLIAHVLASAPVDERLSAPAFDENPPAPLVERSLPSATLRAGVTATALSPSPRVAAA
jgi:hypothetical protein